MQNIPQLIQMLTGHDQVAACEALKQLQKISQESNLLYPFWDSFVAMLGNENSYVRTRGLILLAHNARWDIQDKLQNTLGLYLEHVVDEKPITARQCIQNLRYISQARPELKPAIRACLLQADAGKYNDSMRPLVEKDIAAALTCTE